MITRNLKLPFFTMIISIIWMWLMVVVALVVVPTIDVIVVTAFHPILLSSTTTISKMRPPLSSSSSSYSSSSAVVSMSKIHSRSSRFRQPTLLNVAMIPTTATIKSTSTTNSSSKSQQQRSNPSRNTSTTTNINDSKNVPNERKETDIGNKASNTVTVDDDDDTDDDINAGVVGNWENLYGNWVLRPTSTKSSEDNEIVENDSTTNITPRAVIHFLGGALVGKAPHITYRFLLEKLADEGFLIVATPYDLSFDHLTTCDDVLTKFENVAPTLARQYGALPVVGIGHSCGALLQVLISCLFPDTPRAANALLSFNNKPVSEAVPFFEDFFAPVFSSLATQPIGGGSSTTTGTDSSSSSSSSSSQPVRGPSSNDSLYLGLKLAKAASQGKLPSDELLSEAQSMFKNAAAGASLLPTIPIPFASPFGGNNNDNDQNIKIPSEIRDTYAKWAEPAVTALTEVGLLPVIHETIVTLEQIPRLIDEVADGARDFNPTPAMVRSAAGKAYRARRTLILGYDDDPIDESAEVEEVLREARSITRMRRPMVEIDVQRTSLSGGHVSPLLAPPLDVAGRAEDLLGLETSQERLGYKEAAATVEALVQWLDEGNL